MNSARLTSKKSRRSLEVEPTMIFVMPMEGFVQSFGAMDTIVNQMVADGVVMKTTANFKSGIQH